MRMSNNRVKRRVLGPKMEEVTEGWRKTHTEETHNLYSSPNITRVIRTGMMRWAEHVSRKDNGPISGRSSIKT